MPSSNENRCVIRVSPVRRCSLPAIVMWFVVATQVAAPPAGYAESRRFTMVQVPAPNEALASLKSEHPRLMMDGDTAERLRRVIETDALAGEWYRYLKGRADEMLDEPLASYDIPDGWRLLWMSRKVLDRMMTLGLVWRIEAEARYADRAWRDLEAAAGFPDWNPSHFLDTAEMTAAFALAYDWMFEYWTDAQRRTIADAIVKHGFEPGMKVYTERHRWATSHHNWNQVCNGGLLMGALAIGDVEPELAGRIVHEAVGSLPLAMQSFAPDGAWFEGPGYWGYAMKYNAMALACLASALGTDFGLSRIEGFDKAGDFFVQMHGTSGASFNYADAHPGRIQHPTLLWLARRFDRPDLAAFQREFGKPMAIGMLWYDPNVGTGSLAQLPTAARYREVEVAAARTSWTDPEALYVGVKAGHNGVNHDNLDLGSFVFDALGERWVVDMGPDDYNLPHYFGKLRYTYYRLRAEGHNTLLINPDQRPDQDVDALCRITRFEHDGDTTQTEADLTPAYAGHGAKQVTRSYTLAADKLTLDDHVELNEPGDVWWFAHTEAKVDLADDGRRATLEQDGKRVTVQLASPAEARFELMPAEPLPTSPDPAGQNPNNGAKLVNHAPGIPNLVVRGQTPQWGEPNPDEAIRKLAIHLSGVASTRITVTFKPAN